MLHLVGVFLKYRFRPCPGGATAQPFAQRAVERSSSRARRNAIYIIDVVVVGRIATRRRLLTIICIMHQHRFAARAFSGYEVAVEAFYLEVVDGYAFGMQFAVGGD